MRNDAVLSAVLCTDFTADLCLALTHSALPDDSTTMTMTHWLCAHTCNIHSAHHRSPPLAATLQDTLT